MLSIYPQAARSHCNLRIILHRLASLLLLLCLPLLPRTALGQASVVSIPDPNLEAAVRAALGKTTGDLTSDDLLSLTELWANGRGISNLAGLNAALNLQILSLEDNPVSDASPLAGLTQLQTLFMDNNHLSSGAPLAGLTNLHVLLLDHNAISDTDWLAGLTQLRDLSMMFDPIGSAAVVGRLNNLTELHLNGTGISDVSFLRGLNNLTILGLGDNNIHDGSPIAGLTGLVFLGMGSNPITNWDFIRGLTNLRTLYLFTDSLSDISFLAGLHNLAWLRLSDNHIRDASPLAGLTQLQYLDLSWNSLTTCQGLAALTALTNLDVSVNSLTDVSALSGLRTLTTLGLNNNQIRDASPLAGLVSLQGLNLRQNLLHGLDFAQSLTQLSSLDASYNRLTDIKGLMGAGSLRSVALNNNLLLLATGSSAYNVIQHLQSLGVTVDASSQSLPYVATSGTYNGLFYADGAVTQSNAGWITLTTTTLRKYTGKLQLGKVTYPLSGYFSADGTDRQTLQRGNQRPLVVALSMEGTDYLTGTVTPSGATPADILGYRAVFNAKTNRFLQAGRYTLMVAGTNSPTLPAGTGYGTFTVSTAGKVTLAGSLADGTKFTQSASLSADKQWPVYASLYSGQGALVSWMSFTNDQALAGNVAWLKAPSKAKCYPAGFAWLTQAAAASYNPPGKGTNAFGLSACDMLLTLTGGDLKQDLTNHFTINAKSQVKALSTANKVTLSLTPSTGVFKGQAVDPDTRKRVSFSGVIMQNQTNACGYFLGSSTSGQVVLCQ